MSNHKLKQIIKEIAPRKNKSRTLLLEFDQLPEAWHWLERQAHLHGTSKTAYVKALIELERKSRKGKVE